MKVAIMQPYVFPYIGYFQLVHVADKFVFYDDVNFIKQGWINRNRILVNGGDHLFTIPVENISSFVEIKDTLIHQRNYGVWRAKFLKSVIQSYKRAPFYDNVISLIEQVISADVKSIAELAELSVVTVSSYLGMTTTFETSSKNFSHTKGLEKAERLIAITKALGADHYVNPIGGAELYEKNHFRNKGIRVDFLRPMGSLTYRQFPTNDFIPWLSIIDVLMFNSAAETNELMRKYELV